MRFLCVHATSRPEGAPPSEAEFSEMIKLVEEGRRTGRLLATEGCLPSALGARVRISDGKFTVVDGPFTESKEIIGGFALIQADSREDAVEYVKQYLGLSGTGEVEVRQLIEAGDCPASQPA